MPGFGGPGFGRGGAGAISGRAAQKLCLSIASLCRCRRAALGTSFSRSSGLYSIISVSGICVSQVIFAEAVRGSLPSFSLTTVKTPPLGLLMGVQLHMRFCGELCLLARGLDWPEVSSRAGEYSRVHTSFANCVARGIIGATAAGDPNHGATDVPLQ